MVDNTDSAKGMNKSQTMTADQPIFAVFNSKLYATWREEKSGGLYHFRVAVYNGNDSSPSWSFIDGNDLNGLNKNPTKTATSPYLSVYKGRLYVAWSEYAIVSEGVNKSQIRVAVYNGFDASNQKSWSFVDGNDPLIGLNQSSINKARLPKMLEHNDKLYMGWYEYNVNSKYQIRVKVGY